MLTKNDLMTQTTIPNVNDISLALYKDFCEDTLLNRYFRYLFLDGTSITIEFTAWGIYHMLSIQHINNRIPRNNLFELIDNGLSLRDFRINKSIKERFRKEKGRIASFSCIYQTLITGRCFYLPTGKVKNKANVEVDYLIFNEIDGKGLNVGIRNTKGRFVPITMLIAKTSNREAYIKDAERKLVKTLEVVNKGDGEILESVSYDFDLVDEKQDEEVECTQIR